MSEIRFGAKVSRITRALMAVAALAAGPAHPQSTTVGWNQTPFTYNIQKPHNLPLSQRYSLDTATGTHTLWVQRGDAPHTTSSNTAPRTEIRFKNDYTSGNHMFDGDLYVVKGTHSCVMQVFGATLSATTVILMAHPDGTIRYYDGPDIIRRNAYDTWWNLKVSHATDGSGQLRFYVNDTLVLTRGGRGRTTHYFKTGVYSVRNGDRSEVRVRNLKYWTRGGVAGVLLPGRSPGRRTTMGPLGLGSLDGMDRQAGPGSTGGMLVFNPAGRMTYVAKEARGPLPSRSPAAGMYFLAVPGGR